MKKFKIFTIAMLLVAASNTFTSCGGGDDKKDDNKKEEEKKADDSTVADNEIENNDDLDIDYTSEADGVGDFYGLKKDLTDLFITNIKNGNIVLGKTTKAEMVKLIGSENFNKEYDGLRVSGYVIYTGDIVSSITLDYFYDTESALSLLDIDKEDITASISEYLGTSGESDGDYKDAGTTWKVGSQIIEQSNFPDGYTISVNK
jgi:hypothetical protein